MKKWIVVLIFTLLLSGCKTQETYETVEDLIPAEPVMTPQQFVVSLPEEAAAPTFQSDSQEIYLCRDYTISKEIFPSGDLEKTVTAVTGMSQQDLQMLKTIHETYDRYDFVWTAAGEEGLQVGRASLYDDGNFHYVLSTLASEETVGELRQEMQTLFDSCKLLDPELNLRNGS